MRAVLFVAVALVVAIAIPRQRACACSAPLVRPEQLDWGPEVVPLEGVVVVRLPFASPFLGARITVIDAAGVEVPGETTESLWDIVWRSEDTLRPEESYEAALDYVGGSVSFSFRAASAPSPAAATPSIREARLTETARIREAGYCNATCRYEPISYDYVPAIEVGWVADGTGLDGRYLRYRWLEPLGDERFGTGPVEDGLPSGDRSSIVSFNERAASYCIVLEAYSLIDESIARSTAVCFDDADLEPVAHVQPGAPECPEPLSRDVDPADGTAATGSGGCSAAGEVPASADWLLALGLVLVWLRGRRG